MMCTFHKYLLYLIVFNVVTFAAPDLALQFSASLSELRSFVGTPKSKIVFVDGIQSVGGDLCYIDLSESSDPPVIHRIAAVTNAKVPVISPCGNWVTYATGSGGEAGSALTTTSSTYICKIAENAIPVLVQATTAYEPRFLQKAVKPTIIYATIAPNQQWNDLTGRTMKVEIDTSKNPVQVGTPTELAGRAFTGGLSYNGNYICGGGGTVGMYKMDAGNYVVDTIDRFSQACNASISSSRVVENAVMFLTFAGQDKQILDSASLIKWQVIFIGRPKSGGMDEVIRYFVRPTVFTYTLNIAPSVRLAAHSSRWHHCEWSNHPNYAIATLNPTRAYVQYPENFPSGNYGKVYGSTEVQERIYLINLVDSAYSEVLRFADSEIKTARTDASLSFAELLWPWLWVEVPANFQENPQFLPIKTPSPRNRRAQQNNRSTTASTNVAHATFDGHAILSQAAITHITLNSMIGQELQSYTPVGSSIRTVKISDIFSVKPGIYFIRVATVDGSVDIFRWVISAR